MTLSQFLAWSPRLPGGLAHTLPVLAAAAVAGAGSAIARGKWAGWAGLPGAAGVLAGWVLLMPAPAWRAALQPRTLPEHLLAPTLAIVLLAAAGPHLHGRLARWAPVAVAALCGWWLARSAGRVEFWRVWAGFGAAAWLLARVSAGQAARTWAAPLAAWGGLAATGAPSALTAPGLVLAAALAPSALLGARAGPVPALLAAVFLADADLAIGRLPQGGVNGADLACLAALGAPVLAWALERRLGRGPRRFGPAPAILAALLAAGTAWIGAGLLGR
ncbi:MAG: hypothetical protein ACRYGM_08115 [Janthinobacterium lividum]